jgi:hypothetical protein
MAPAPRRWIRLDTGWSSTEWLAELEPAARLAWVELLAYVKTEGIAGTAKAIAPTVFGRRFAIPPEAVRAMLQAAETGEAIACEDGSWRIVKWAEYQHTDPAAKDRMKKHRAEKSALSPLRRNARNTRNVTGSYDVTRHATETETVVTKEDAKASLSDLASPSSDVREVFDHWVAQTGRDPARTQLTPSRREKIRARLREHPPTDLKRAIDGVMKSDHHRSKPEYTDLTSCFRSAERVEGHIARATASGAPSIQKWEQRLPWQESA